MRFGQIMHELSEFLKFYINAVNLHSIHSPSVFRILSSLERDQEMPELADLNLWWDSLKGDSTATSGDQYGAGTRISRPTISSAARISSSSDKKALFIARLAKALDSHSILELGTNLGKTSAMISLLNPSSKIHTVEGNELIARKAGSLFKYLKCFNIRQYIMRFEDFLDNYKPTVSGSDLIFLDGDHSYQKTKDYIRILLEHPAHKKAILIDDIHWSSGMTKAWKEICAELEHGISIDFFKCGLILIDPAFAERQHIQYISKKYKFWSWGLFP